MHYQDDCTSTGVSFTSDTPFVDVVPGQNRRKGPPTQHQPKPPLHRPSPPEWSAQNRFAPLSWIGSRQTSSVWLDASSTSALVDANPVSLDANSLLIDTAWVSVDAILAIVHAISAIVDITSAIIDAISMYALFDAISEIALSESPCLHQISLPHLLYTAAATNTAITATQATEHTQFYCVLQPEQLVLYTLCVRPTFEVASLFSPKSQRYLYYMQSKLSASEQSRLRKAYDFLLSIPPSSNESRVGAVTFSALVKLH
ncbi:hypothetical protein PCASD_08930 [Puccinia coronata f. sp. avenae]|uniref:Uncharacterized protein n=1 Tax=Puccinia coronata f. sp. avenae TaxID=200324 RepID=A0A2N5TCE5_9BASI|nr:hypothetical protein PCASD_14836 [Puccinia coronata f. sp. avenae]PLW39078.1 hypothetical protein PCASD_08930 [Puccinia coronata f. sp. avenae]